MFEFSSRSEHWLRTIHPDLKRVFRRALQLGAIDFGVIDGHRGQERQDAYFFGVPQRSKVQWPNGKHNAFPSEAGDLKPWVAGRNMYAPGAEKYWYVLVGVIKATAAIEGVAIRCGADWDGDSDMDDQIFDDLGHVELAREEVA